jgi:hypothetical protein
MKVIKANEGQIFIIRPLEDLHFYFNFILFTLLLEVCRQQTERSFIFT